MEVSTRVNPRPKADANRSKLGINAQHDRKSQLLRVNPGAGDERNIGAFKIL